MDIQLLAEALTQMLVPALPYLVQGGQDLVADAGKALGTGAWEKVKGLWERLYPRVEERPIAKAAAQEVAKAPEDSEAVETLRRQLKRILEEDETFAAEIAKLLEAAGGPSFTATVQGSGAVAQGPGAVAAGAGGVAVGRDVHGDIVLGREPKRE